MFAAVVVAPATLAALPAASGVTYALPEGSGYTLFVPTNFRASGDLDLVVHFHGSDSVYDANDQYAGLNALSVTINLGALSGSYQTPFANDVTLFGRVLDDSLAKARSLASIPDTAVWRRVAVTSFSAGYGAVREVLKQPAYYARIDAMVLADTVYASYTSGTDLTPLDSQMVNFRRYAQDAVAGTKVLTMTHSLVPTSGYCDTKTCADDVMAFAGVTAGPYSGTGLGGINFYRAGHAGNFNVYGATGADGGTHLLFENYIGQWEGNWPLGYVPEPGVGVVMGMAVLAGGRRRRRISCGA